jgi:hypothetical protein
MPCDARDAKLMMVLRAFCSQRPHRAMSAGITPAVVKAAAGTCVWGEIRLNGALSGQGALLTVAVLVRDTKSGLP